MVERWRRIETSQPWALGRRCPKRGVDEQAVAMFLKIWSRADDWPPAAGSSPYSRYSLPGSLSEELRASSYSPVLKEGALGGAG